MEDSMEMVYILHQREIKRRDYGRMGRTLNGFD
jgi:hypothetical protein